MHADRRRHLDRRQHLPRPGPERAARHGGGVHRHRHAEERRAVPRRRRVRPRPRSRRASPASSACCATASRSSCRSRRTRSAHKGARLTQEVSLAGRFVVMVPGQPQTYGISKRLPDDERKRLRRVLDGLRPADAGLIVRTAAEGATEDELERDMRRLNAAVEADLRPREEGEAGQPALQGAAARDPAASARSSRRSTAASSSTTRRCTRT